MSGSKMTFRINNSSPYVLYIAELEQLVQDMFEEFRYTPNSCHWDAIEKFEKRINDLGIEVK